MHIYVCVYMYVCISRSRSRYFQGYQWDCFYFVIYGMKICFPSSNKYMYLVPIV